jgi:hypothetical protein
MYHRFPFGEALPRSLSLALCLQLIAHSKGNLQKPVVILLTVSDLPDKLWIAVVYSHDVSQNVAHFIVTYFQNIIPIHLDGIFAVCSHQAWLR